MIKLLYTLIIISAISSCSTPAEMSNEVHKAKEIIIDGHGTEASWQAATWHTIDQVWIGEPISEEDFSGRYKLLWSEKYLYVLAEIQDDTLIDIYPNGLNKYWNDDCLEVFIDEDRSKGIHQYNHNAFAYHMSLDGKVVDIGPDSLPHYYDHVDYKRITEGTRSTWELAFQLYSDQYKDNDINVAERLHPNKKIGFAIAYCDNDLSTEREHFIGSEVIMAENKDLGWIDAGVFGEIILK